MSLPFYECPFCRKRLVDCDGRCRPSMNAPDTIYIHPESARWNDRQMETYISRPYYLERERDDYVSYIRAGISYDLAKIVEAQKAEIAELRAERDRLIHYENAVKFLEAAGFARMAAKANEAIELSKLVQPGALASPPAAEEPSTKGRYGAECNRASCHNVPATWKHRDIPRHYCQPCGMWINENSRDGVLCTPPAEEPATALFGHPPAGSYLTDCDMDEDESR